MESFVIKGDICWNRSQTELETVRDGFLVCVDGMSEGVYQTLPEAYSTLPLIDHGGKLVIPGMVDLHIHAPQFAFRGLGMDLELLDWLKTYTFPEEAKYADMEYAEKAYGIFADKLRESATTRAAVFATVHRNATILLMDKLEAAGLMSYVGKINMDTDAPDNLREPSAEFSAYDTFGWLNAIQGRYDRTLPILTPRFLPSCSEKLLDELHEIQLAYDLPIQSHLSENPGEVELVHRLFPKAAFYGQGYDRYGLFGKGKKTVMAHCIYSTPEEIELMRQNGVYVAHCPASNMNLASGIAPIRRYLNLGIPVGLGSDVAGGESESIFRAISDAVQVSKLYWRLVDSECRPLSFEEAFYLATVGGGSFFGDVGSFAEGFEFDAVVLDDRALWAGASLSVAQRVQRAVYLEADSTCIVDKFVRGQRISLDRDKETAAGQGAETGCTIVKLSDRPELKECAAEWFSSKWNVPYEAYLESIEASFHAVVPSWYLCLENGKIAAGMGVIENDFHDRKDLTPNVCAVFTEPAFRNRGLAGKLLHHVCEDMKASGIDTLYLLTDHTGFYERYGWSFLCMVQGDGEDRLSRMYIHRS